VLRNRADAPRDLLFGLLALQNGMVSQAQLVAAFGAWTLARDRPMADVLVGPLSVRRPTGLHRALESWPPPLHRRTRACFSDLHSHLVLRSRSTPPRLHRLTCSHRSNTWLRRRRCPTCTTLLRLFSTCPRLPLRQLLHQAGTKPPSSLP
jgi:hypothetical protein